MITWLNFNTVLEAYCKIIMVQHRDIIMISLGKTEWKLDVTLSRLQLQHRHLLQNLMFSEFTMTELKGPY